MSPAPLPGRAGPPAGRSPARGGILAERIGRTAALLLAGLVAAAAPAARAGDPPAGKGGHTAAGYFKGKVVSLKGRRIALAYDFSDPAQAADWTHSHPFLEPPTSGGWRVEGGALRADGNGAFRHRAVFQGEVRLQATISCEDARNYGALVLDAEGPGFDLFALADAFFSIKDRRLGHEHMITTFLPPGSAPGGGTAWRYVQTGRDPRLTGEPIKIDVRKKGAMNQFIFAGTGRLGGNDAEVRLGPKLWAAFYTLGSRVVVDDVTLSGVLDAGWLTGEGIEFEEKTPDEAPAEEPAPAPPSPTPAPAPGGAPAPAPPAPVPVAGDWNRLADKVADGTASKADRDAAAAALVALKEKRAARRMIDLLYSEDDPLGREIGIRVFKGLLGKDGGYVPAAPREARKKAMPNVWEAWLAARTAIEKEEAARAPKEKNQ